MAVDLITRAGMAQSAAIEVAEALCDLRKASDAMHDRDEPDETDAATTSTPMPMQKIDAAQDRLDAAVLAYQSVR